MSPVFTPDFTKVESNIPTYKKGRYRLKVTKRTPVVDSKMDNDTNVKTLRQKIRYAFEMVGRIDESGELQQMDEEGVNLMGRSVSTYDVWLHTEGGWKFAKPFLMASAGFKKNQENEANAELFQANEWFIDGEEDAAPENIKVGAGYDIPLGKFVDVTLEVKLSPNKNDESSPYENQDFKSWSPVKI